MADEREDPIFETREDLDAWIDEMNHSVALAPILADAYGLEIDRVTKAHAHLPHTGDAPLLAPQGE